MEGRSVVWLLAALLLDLISAEDQNSLKYLEVGGKLVLSPEPVSDPITSITWKFNGSIVGEWNKETLPLEFSPAFQGRANVDTNTGVLEMNNMMKTDTGVYTVEINDSIQRGSHDVRVIKQVPKPKVIMRPLTCSQSSKSCNLTCDGDVKEAGPVTFYFKKGDGDWEEGEQNIEITNDKDTQAVKTFSCRMENPLGQKDSEPVDNLFYVKSNTGNTVGIVIGVLVIAVCAGVAGFFFYRKKQKSGSKKLDRTTSPEDGMQGAGLLNHVQPQNGGNQELELANDVQPQNEGNPVEAPANDVQPQNGGNPEEAPANHVQPQNGGNPEEAPANHVQPQNGGNQELELANDLNSESKEV